MQPSVRVSCSRLIGSILVGAALLAGCSGGGSSPTDPVPMPDPSCVFAAPPPGFPDRTATFTPDGPAVAGSVSLQAGTNCADLLVLQLVATGLTNVAGIRYQIDFPSDLLFADTSRLGPFLTSGGTVQVSGSAGTAGELMRVAGSGSVSGSGQIVLIAWVYNGPLGNATLTLTGEVLDVDGNPIPGVQLIGGTLIVSQ